MPNWCNNSLIVTGTRTQIQKVKAFLKGTYPQYSDDPTGEAAITCDLCFNNIIPVPAAVLKNGYSNVRTFKNGKPVGPKLTGMEGYDWQVKNWGTKWAAAEIASSVEEISTTQVELVYSFDTAWSPMGENLVAKLSEQFPKVEFTLKYHEPGSQIVGQWVYKAGQCLSREDISDEDYRDGVIDIWDYDPFEDDEEENSQYEAID